jgi:xanthine/uracil permease
VIATVVDWDALLQVAWVSLLAGVGVTAAWAFALVGTTRALESGRDRRAAEAVLYGAVGVAGIVTVVAAIVFGIVILTGD